MFRAGIWVTSWQDGWDIYSKTEYEGVHAKGGPRRDSREVSESGGRQDEAQFRGWMEQSTRGEEGEELRAPNPTPTPILSLGGKPHTKFSMSHVKLDISSTSSRMFSWIVVYSESSLFKCPQRS
jgi:hypothetical protein